MDRQLRERAARQYSAVSREDVFAAGGSDDVIRNRVGSGEWVSPQAGVYGTTPAAGGFRADLMAAVLAGGSGCLASHRSALVLWGMDGIGSAPVEITAPYGNRPIPIGVIVHRTRRAMEHTDIAGIPVTTPNRTLLDCCAVLPRLVVVKALESALRKRLTTVDSLYTFLAKKGGRGVRGTKRLRWVLAERISDTPTDSGSETELLFHMRQALVPAPVLQQEFKSADGRPMRPDFYWPHFNKAVEVDGLDAHDSADKLDHDLVRQNALLDLGIELRRFSARRVRREPSAVVDEIVRFLGL